MGYDIMECYICGENVGLYYDSICQDCLNPQLEVQEEYGIDEGLLFD